MIDGEVLQDREHRLVTRVGDTVRRPVHPWTGTVHELLRYLAEVGFPYSPRVVGVDEHGREVLTFLHGDSGAAGWSHVVTHKGLVATARLLREYHQAVAGFRPPPDAVWAGHTAGPGPGEIVCHGDFGPWNLVWRDGRPAGILDWDYAVPAPPLHDVAYALEYSVPFRPDAECLDWLRYPAPPDRARRLEIFATAYGLTSVDGLVDEVIRQQREVLARARRLAAAGHQPQATWEAAGHLAQVEHRIEWSRTHRHLFGP